MKKFEKLRVQTATVQVKTNLSPASIQRLLTLHNINICDEACYLLSEVGYGQPLLGCDFQVVLAAGIDFGIYKPYIFTDLYPTATAWGLQKASTSHIVQVLSGLMTFPGYDFNLAMEPIQVHETDLLFRSLLKSGPKWLTTTSATELIPPETLWGFVPSMQ